MIGPLFLMVVSLTDTQWTCIQKAASSRPELKDHQKILDAIAQDQNLKQVTGIMEEARMQFLEQASPVANMPWLHRKTTGPNGEVQHLFNLPNIPAKEYAKPETQEALSQAACAGLFPQGGEQLSICQVGAKNRLENFAAFHRQYAEKFSAFAKTALQSSNPEWNQIIKPSDFSDVDSVTRSHFNFGRHFQIPFAKLVDSFGADALEMFPFVMNPQGQPIGVLTPVVSNGQTLFAVGKFVGGGPDLLSIQIEWPFPHLFNQGSEAFERWNEAVAAQYGGELFVGGKPIKEFIRDSSNR